MKRKVVASMFLAIALVFGTFGSYHTVLAASAEETDVVSSPDFFDKMIDMFNSDQPLKPNTKTETPKVDTPAAPNADSKGENPFKEFDESADERALIKDFAPDKAKDEVISDKYMKDIIEYEIKDKMPELKYFADEKEGVKVVLPSTNNETKPEDKMEVTPEVKPEVKIEATPEVKPEDKTEVTPEIKLEDKTNVKGDRKSEKKSEVKVDKKIEAKVEKKSEPKVAKIAPHTGDVSVIGFSIAGLLSSGAIATVIKGKRKK